MTHLTIIWLGQAISAAVLALASVLPGSAVLGNIFFDTAIQATPAIYVGAQQTLNPQAGGLSFPTNGTQSGIVLSDNSITAYNSYTVNCTGTGGNVKVSGGAKYDTCIVPLNRFTGSGVLTKVELMVSASPAVVGIDCGIVGGLVSGSGAASFTGISNAQTATGAYFVFGSGGGIRARANDYVKCGTLGTPTTSFAAKIRVQTAEDTSR